MATTLLLPAGSVEPATTGPVAALQYASADEARDAITAAAGPVVLVSDGIAAADEAVIAAAIREHEATVIEVQSERWDGVTHSLLSAACRGVIAGFGLAGAMAAVQLLEREEG